MPTFIRRIKVDTGLRFMIQPAEKSTVSQHNILISNKYMFVYVMDANLQPRLSVVGSVAKLTAAIITASPSHHNRVVSRVNYS